MTVSDEKRRVQLPMSDRSETKVKGRQAAVRYETSFMTRKRSEDSDYRVSFVFNVWCNLHFIYSLEICEKLWWYRDAH